MASRILTLQRQVRELGRLRAGWTETKNGKTYPVKSQTWLVTSASQEYVEAAAEAWGGTAEKWKPQGNGAEQWRVITETNSIDALLPPGDPVSQAYELWSGGGCQRRCDGETAAISVGEKLEQRPCACRAQFGAEFHKQPAGKVCKPTTRLGLIVPELPDLGLWRMESHGFYAANEITATVDLIKSRVNPNLVIPVTVRIEPRTRVAQGKTKQFTVITVGLRGATAMQILAGAVPALALDGAPERAALPAGPTTQPQPVAGREQPLTADRALKDIASARNQKQLDALKGDFRAAGLRDQAVIDAWTARSAELAKPTSAPPVQTAPPAEVVDPDDEPEPDKAAAWMQAMALVGAAPHRWNAEQLEAATVEYCGKPSAACNGWELSNFLDSLKKGLVPA